MFFLQIISEIYKVFMSMAPYLLLGITIAGILSQLFSKEWVAGQIGKNSIGSIVKSTLLGVPLPLCSCGVIPTAVFIKKSGASKSSVISFLISTPQTGVDSIIATYGMMGPVFAIFRPLAAFLMGIIGGIVALLFGDHQEIKREKINEKRNDDQKTSLFNKFKKMIRYGYIDFLDDIVIQLFWGILIAGLISFFLPNDLFKNNLISSGFLGMVLVSIAGIPMYVCATASIPIAVALMAKGFSPGIAYVFLVTGPVTNAASFTLILKTLGRKLTLIYLVSIFILSILFGYLLDALFYSFNLDPVLGMDHVHSGNLSSLAKFSSWFFLGLVLLSFLRKITSKLTFRKKEDRKMNKKKIMIQGMECKHCQANVEQQLSELDGVTQVEVDLANGFAYVDQIVDNQSIRQAIESVGYQVTEIQD